MTDPHPQGQGGKHRAGGPPDEDRLAELARTGLVGSPPEEEFDRITRLARQLLGADAAFVSLVDAEHQYFKSADGLAPGVPRLQPLSESFCKYAVATGDPFVVHDAPNDPLVHNSPAIENLQVQAYAGWPLETTRGNVLGTVCVVHHAPHDWTDDELRLLEDLSALAITEVEFRLGSGETRAIGALAEQLVDPLDGLADAVRLTAQLTENPDDPRLPRTADVAVQRLRSVEEVAEDLRATVGRSALAGPSLDLGMLLERCVALTGAHADADALDVRCPELPVHVQARASLQRPLAALLHAGVQHLGPGHRCRVEVEQEGGVVTLAVTSPGAGLPNAALLRLVSKFTSADTGDDPTRTETAAVRRQGGRTVVEHGSVRAANGPEGFEFRVAFTAVDPSLQPATA